MCVCHTLSYFQKPWERALSEVHISEVVAQAQWSHMAGLGLEPAGSGLFPVYNLDPYPAICIWGSLDRLEKLR